MPTEYFLNTLPNALFDLFISRNEQGYPYQKEVRGWQTTPTQRVTAFFKDLVFIAFKLFLLP